MWSYRRNEKGAIIDEWEWFTLLKRELGIQVKYTKSQHQKSVESALQAMNAMASKVRHYLFKSRRISVFALHFTLAGRFYKCG